jgi:hypothetical protein
MVALFVITGAYYLRDINSVPSELKKKGADAEIPPDASEDLTQADGNKDDETDTQSNSREE